MKRFASQLTVLLVMSAAAGLMVSCAKQSGPLSPNIPLLSAANSANNNLPTVSSSLTDLPSGSGPSAVAHTARVVFTQPMDPATLVPGGSVLVYTMNDDGKSETQYSAFSATYDPATKCMLLIPTNGAWDDNKAYHFVFTTGCRGVNGKPLDGNYNGKAESDEFDTAHGFTEIGTIVSPGYGLSGDFQNGIRANPSLTYGGTSHGGLVFGSYQSPQVNYAGLTITVQFQPFDHIPADFQMDTSTFFTDAVSLHPNIVLIDAATNIPVAPVNVTVTSNYNPNSFDTLQILLTPAYGTKMKLKIRGGLSGVRASNAPTINLIRGMYFSGVTSGTLRGRPQASDDTEDMTIQVQPSDTTMYPSVQVSGSSYDLDLRRITLTFSVPTGVGTLDAATVGNSTIKLIDTASGRGFVASNIVVDNAPPNPRVYVYIPLQFYTTDNINTTLSTADRIIRVTVLPDVKSSDGHAMDQNGDKVLGTPQDGYTTTFTARNIVNGP